MNFKIILKTIGKVMIVEAILLLVPFITSLIYGEGIRHALASGAVAVGLAAGGLCLDKLLNPEKTDFFAKDGLITRVPLLDSVVGIRGVAVRHLRRYS